MVLDHSSLDLEKKFLENKSVKSFVFNKFALQNLAKKSGGLLLHITSEVKEYYEVLFLSFRPRTVVFHNFEIQIVLIQYSG